MRRLNRPTEAARVVFVDCADGVGDAGLRARLLAVADMIQAEAVRYGEAAEGSELHLLDEQGAVGAVSGAEMMALYDSRMARKGSPGRPLYDQLIVAAPLGLCPLCAQRIVSTLDHHLPKSRYPALACVMTNLVPSCSDCNKLKGNRRPQSVEEQTMHPYFDDFEGEVWLGSEVVEETPPAIRFFVEAPAGWCAVRVARAQHHFEMFKLGALYAAQAGQELVSIVYHLRQLFQAAGPDAVRTHLAEQAESRAQAYVNSWQGATYRAWAESQWFWAGGFDGIGM